MKPGFSILVIEDDVPFSSNLRDVLEDEGYVVAVAHDGRAALACCQQIAFNIALVDIKLPGMSGPEVISELSQLCPDTEYIIITAYASLETAVAAVEQKKVIAYESKPLDFDHLLSFIRQVAERQQAEQKARESQQLYQLLADNVVEVIAAADANLNITYVSPSVVHMLGYTAEELSKRKLSELLTPSSLEKVRQLSIESFEQTFDGSFKAQTLLLEVVCKNGSRIWTETTVRPLYSKGGLDGYLTVTRDVTRRVETQTRINVSNALLRLLLKKSTKEEFLDETVKIIHRWVGCDCVGIRALDESGNIPYAAHTGFSEEFLALENNLSIVRDQCACIRVISSKPDPQDCPVMTTTGSFCCNGSSDFLGKLGEKEQWRFRGTCTRMGFESIAIVPVHYGDKIIGAIHITDKRKEALPLRNVEFIESIAPIIGEAVYRFHVEEKLRQSEASLIEAQRIGRLGDWDWDIVKNELRWSDEIYRIFGLTPQEFAATFEAFLNRVHPDDKDSVQAAVRKALLDGNPYSIDHRIALPDGSERTVHEQGEVTFDQSGTPLRMIGTVHDITEHKRIETELRSLSRRLFEVQERERRAIGRELHDEIGQSMTVLMLALDRAKHSPPEAVSARLAETQAVANEVITQVRNMSLDLRPPMLDDLGLLPTFLWHFERYTNQTGIQVDFKHSGLDSALPAEANTAAYRIVQEALTNVARYAKVKEVLVRAWVDGTTLSLQVEDHGAGFSMDGHAISGGLSGMRERATLLGGKLAIQSAPGAGTCVTAELPLSTKAKKSEAG